MAWVLPVLLAAANAAQASGTERDSVVSYFRDRVSRTDSSSWISSCEWHVYDPARRVDRLLLTLPGRAQVIQWDTTFTSVCFTSVVGIHHKGLDLPLRLALRCAPRLVGVLPPPKGSTDYWFNPDSARWQASLEWPVAGDTLWRRELWQADRQGREWRRLRGDSVHRRSSRRVTGGVGPSGGDAARIRRSRSPGRSRTSTASTRKPSGSTLPR